MNNDPMKELIDREMRQIFQTKRQQKMVGNDITEYIHERAEYWSKVYDDMSDEDLVMDTLKDLQKILGINEEAKK